MTKGYFDMASKDAFVKHLENASSVVRTWPAWKQELLGGKAFEGSDKMQVPTNTPITVVREYFPNLDDKQAEAILWGLTGWPSFWSDCDENCDNSVEALERHLRHDLQKIKDRVDQGETISEQHDAYDEFVRKELYKHNAYQRRKLEDQIDIAMHALSAIAAGSTNPRDLAKQTIASIHQINKQDPNK
jgi:hypothetical protein